MSDYGEIVCGHTVVADGGDKAHAAGVLPFGFFKIGLGLNEVGFRLLNAIGDNAGAGQKSIGVVYASLQ